ncbi:hypothetical protein DFH11DRAFT_1732952 [Phellopilus nigrolimitatus]|nr:hypothetical protein DFH11DRAFT_1732952 [Phellopilus nigrolimitatus]
MEEIDERPPNVMRRTVRPTFSPAHSELNGVTGPVPARFSDLWLGWVAAQGHRSEVVHELHKKYSACLCSSDAGSSREEHTRKRKIVAHFFSPKEVRVFEPYVRELLVRWDALCLAFDIIGNLAFVMIQAGKEVAPVAKDTRTAIVGYGAGAALAAQVLNDRGEYSAAMGVLPPRWRPLAGQLP